MSQALARIENNQQIATKEFMPALEISQAVTRFNQLVSFVQQVMKKDIDFGCVPGTDKPTLLKPGAEKLNTFFGHRSEPEIIKAIEDWDKGFFYYHYRVKIYRGDQLICACDGSANSKEKKYRWRSVPAYKATDFEKSSAVRTEQRNGKNNSKYTVYILENTEPYDLVNTLQKMAQKRALVGATLLAVNASEFFTQDMEDLAIDAEVEYSEPHQAQSAHPEQNKQATSRATTSPAPSQEPQPRFTQEELTRIKTLWAEIGQLCDKNHITKDQVKQFIKKEFGIKSDALDIPQIQQVKEWVDVPVAEPVTKDTLIKDCHLLWAKEIDLTGKCAESENFRLTVSELSEEELTDLLGTLQRRSANLQQKDS